LDEEGWPFIDQLEDNVYRSPINGECVSGHLLPSVLHYCQFFRVGENGFQKRRIPKALFTCDYPLLEELPTNLSLTRFKVKDGETVPKTQQKARRDSFMLCYTSFVN
jgi:hypothetical protein